MKVLSLWKGDLLAPPRTMSQIGREVAERHGISLADLKGADRGVNKVARARQEAMWLMAEEVRPDGFPRYTLSQIAGWFGRDHTTVVHGRRAHAERHGLAMVYRPRSGWGAAA
jgi:chromosomal replication initiation ATPase DnaA